MWTYVFVPKGLDRSTKHPLLLLPHGGVHGDFDTYYTHVVRELMARGYVVVAPEYRGSTGYGREYWEAIDYGGLEVDDVDGGPGLGAGDARFRGRRPRRHPRLEPRRAHRAPGELRPPREVSRSRTPGVPVSDLVARMGYQTQEYRDLYSADYHIGKTAYEDVDEYRRRSPVTNAHKQKTPLLVHTNTNDRDVNVLEVENLIAALKAADKDFEYRIYEDAPGGHSFNRMDHPLALESRDEIYRFLAKHLGR